MLSTCQYCKKEFKFAPDKRHKGKFCSNKCYSLKRWGKFKTDIIDSVCKICKKKFKVRIDKTHKGFYCSLKCFRESENLRRKKEYIAFSSRKHRPYILVFSPTHPYAINRYVRKHRLVMERKAGRYLKAGEVVHHIDNNPLNNRISNLKLMTHGEHSSFHNKGNHYSHK